MDNKEPESLMAQAPGFASPKCPVLSSCAMNAYISYVSINACIRTRSVASFTQNICRSKSGGLATEPRSHGRMGEGIEGRSNLAVGHDAASTYKVVLAH